MEPRRRVCYLTRTEQISAAHRLDSPHLSAEDNALTYGRCNRPHGHGHNYRVHVTVRGAVDPKTGMVLSIEHLKGAMGAVLGKLDHRNLDVEVPFFAGDGGPPRPSTTEMLAVHVWEALEGELGAVAGCGKDWALHEVRIDETDKNTVSYRGESE
ncbi:hypothetical protein DFJ74DRAFT_238710 [Hyaloraphidium curvatum]|nr:hypothetical protein DFJ74DRAFT_238710 [Hyaloraphidium curvatum]